MADYYKHIYASLRSAVVDRDRDTTEQIESATLVRIGEAGVMLKKEIPSAALLISYSMLYYPNWLESKRQSNTQSLPLSFFLGGTSNIKYPLLFNIHMAQIALAVGVYAGLYRVDSSIVLKEPVITPNYNNPLVLKTKELINENHLTYHDARDVFIELMQQEEYKADILLADDYVANAKFVPIATAGIGDPNEYIEQIARGVEEDE